MIPFIEHRLYTQVEQTVIIQANEDNSGLVLTVRENVDATSDVRLYLNFDEADTLCMLLEQMKEHIKC